jgi:hypothetical protein
MRRALACFVVLVAGQVARADVALEIEEPAALHVGDHLTLTVTLRPPPDASPPLLITPSSEGEALEVVRGRFLRADARDPNASPLVFDLPVVAARPGRSVIRVRAQGFRCDQSCEPFTFDAQRTLLVTAN